VDILMRIDDLRKLDRAAFCLVVEHGQYSVVISFQFTFPGRRSIQHTRADSQGL
jgi:hypothetical protein